MTSTLSAPPIHVPQAIPHPKETPPIYHWFLFSMNTELGVVKASTPYAKDRFATGQRIPSQKGGLQAGNAFAGYAGVIALTSNNFHPL